jgi:hypothetical protein
MLPFHPKTCTQPKQPKPNEITQPTSTPVTTRNQDPFPAMEAQMSRPTTSKTIAKMPDPSVKQRQYSISTSSEEMEVTTQANSNDDWQLIRRTKRKRLYNNSVHTPPTETTNRCKMLADDITKQNQTDISQPPTQHNPPPIFIHGVLN